MKSLMVDYDEKADVITQKKDAAEEAWVDVCHKFNDDVHRLKDVSDMEDFTGLYQCFDNDNRPSHYLVQEDKTLYRLRHKHFLNKLGVQPDT